MARYQQSGHARLQSGLREATWQLRCDLCPPALRGHSKAWNSLGVEQSRLTSSGADQRNQKPRTSSAADCTQGACFSARLPSLIAQHPQRPPHTQTGTEEARVSKSPDCESGERLLLGHPRPSWCCGDRVEACRNAAKSDASPEADAQDV
jgi:hypothetical protein